MPPPPGFNVQPFSTIPESIIRAPPGFSEEKTISSSPDFGEMPTSKNLVNPMPKLDEVEKGNDASRIHRELWLGTSSTVVSLIFNLTRPTSLILPQGQLP